MQRGGSNFTHGEDVLTFLNRDLANEMNTMCMYMADGFLAKGIESPPIRELATKFAEMDLGHVQRIAARIVELEGIPQVMPIQVENNATIDIPAPKDGAIQPMLKNALQSEMQSVIEYRNQVQNIGFADPTTRLLLEEVLADKEHQVEEIRHLMTA